MFKSAILSSETLIPIYPADAAWSITGTLSDKDAYNVLPEGLKWINDIAAKETRLWSYNWINGLNGQAVRRHRRASPALRWSPWGSWRCEGSFTKAPRRRSPAASSVRPAPWGYSSRRASFKEQRPDLDWTARLA